MLAIRASSDRPASPPGAGVSRETVDQWSLLTAPVPCGGRLGMRTADPCWRKSSGTHAAAYVVKSVRPWDSPQPGRST